MTLQLHPINRGFVWSDHPGPYRVIEAGQARVFDRDGFVRLCGILDTGVLAQVRERLDAYEAEAARRLEVCGGTAGISRSREITFTARLAGTDEVLRRFVSSSPLVDVAVDLLGPDVRLYWDQAVYKKPEAPRPFPWHQDTGYIFTQPQTYLTCWIPLTDATVENGCPWILPGVHRHGTLRHDWTELGWVCHPDDGSGVPVEAAVGDVVVFSSLSPHRTGPNRTDVIRKAYIVQFAVDGTYWPGDDAAPSYTGPCDDPTHQFLVARGGRLLDG